MVDTNEVSVSMSYVYYKGEEGPVDGKVDILQRMQFDPQYVQGVVAKEIAKMLKEHGKFVWRNGQPIVGGTDKVDKSTSVDIVVDGSFETFTLQAFDAGTPNPHLKNM
ncbi:hypothetical protein PS645_01467 [Pseudomonas fluorescens]|uniref:Uncharacterized protein n=1 Tax=Pseudomonas fluorescens TaxID=294 RepID=A0A5E6RDL1_PSEFL|nr:hypothetical protein [Pseudomonas fluorescens]VVM64883.1 hypothetical protein PS645_01467 [Pseudomonas fluorescens]